MNKPKCGKCFKYAKTKIINTKTNEVAFICKEHGDITSYVEFEEVRKSVK